MPWQWSVAWGASVIALALFNNGFGRFDPGQQFAKGHNVIADTSATGSCRGIEPWRAGHSAAGASGPDPSAIRKSPPTHAIRAGHAS